MRQMAFRKLGIYTPTLHFNLFLCVTGNKGGRSRHGGDIVTACQPPFWTLRRKEQSVGGLTLHFCQEWNTTFLLSGRNAASPEHTFAHTHLHCWVSGCWDKYKVTVCIHLLLCKWKKLCTIRPARINWRCNKSWGKQIVWKEWCLSKCLFKSLSLQLYALLYYIIFILTTK